MKDLRTIPEASNGLGVSIQDDSLSSGKPNGAMSS